MTTTTMIDGLLTATVNQRRKPRIRLCANGECLYSFATNSWVIFNNIQRAYRFLINTTTRARHPSHNPQW